MTTPRSNREWRELAEQAQRDLAAAQEALRRAEERAAQNEADARRLDWFEQRANEGGSPALVPDDDGRWAVEEDGIQSVPDGEGPQDISTSFFIEAGQWRNTVREAIDAAMEAK